MSAAQSGGKEVQVQRHLQNAFCDGANVTPAGFWSFPPDCSLFDFIGTCQCFRTFDLSTVCAFPTWHPLPLGLASCMSVRRHRRHGSSAVIRRPLSVYWYGAFGLSDITRPEKFRVLYLSYSSSAGLLLSHNSGPAAEARRLVAEGVRSGVYPDPGSGVLRPKRILPYDIEDPSRMQMPEARHRASGFSDILVADRMGECWAASSRHAAAP